MRILSPFRSSALLIFLRNQPVIWGLVASPGRGTTPKGAYASS